MKNILEIVDRVKLVKHFINDGDVALLLKLSKGALSAHKKRGSIPYEALSIFCEQEGLSFDWLLTGEGPKERCAAETTVFKLKEPGMPYGSTATIKKEASLEEEEYVIKLRRVFREKDTGTISAITQNIDTFLRVPDKKSEQEAKTEEEPLKKKINPT